MFEVRGLQAWWGAAQALFDVSLAVGPGELVVLQGLNGAGKSTLLQAVMGLGPRCRGSVHYQGREMLVLPTHARARAGLGVVPEQRRLFGSLTVAENLLLAAAVPQQQRLHEVLELFPALRTALQRPAAQMSGGEQQMLAIARTLMTSPSMLLLDEPCEGIAPLLVESIRDTLLQLKRQGMPMLVAEQNSLLADHADRLVLLAAGQVVSTSKP